MKNALNKTQKWWVYWLIRDRPAYAFSFSAKRGPWFCGPSLSLCFSPLADPRPSGERGVVVESSAVQTLSRASPLLSFPKKYKMDPNDSKSEINPGKKERGTLFFRPALLNPRVGRPVSHADFYAITHRWFQKRPSLWNHVEHYCGISGWELKGGITLDHLRLHLEALNVVILKLLNL